MLVRWPRVCRSTVRAWPWSSTAGGSWFYMPEMRADEAILIKCYDSAEDGRARFTAHSAFEDPTAPTDVLPRESIELRTLAFHA